MDSPHALSNFFEKSEDKNVLEIQKELYELIAGNDPEGAYNKAQILLCKPEEIPDLDTYSGILSTYGWANFVLGSEAQQQEKIKYFIEARKALENARMAKPFLSLLRKANIFFIFREIEQCVGSYEIERCISQEDIDFFARRGKKTEGIALFRIEYRLEQKPEDPIERAKLLIMRGQARLDLGWPDEEKEAVERASEYWREVLSMQERGEKIYPSQTLLAIMGILGNDPKITSEEATSLYNKGLELASSGKEKEVLIRFYLIAIRRSNGPKYHNLAFLV